MSTLYVMIGIPGSGKSTWIYNHLHNENTLVVSRDAIRFSMLGEYDDYFSKEKEVYHRFVRQIADYINENVDVVADATHLRKGARIRLISDICSYGISKEQFEIIYIYVATSLEESIKHNHQRTGRALVPDDKITEMYNHLDKPRPNEISNLKEVWVIHQ